MRIHTYIQWFEGHSKIDQEFGKERRNPYGLRLLLRITEVSKRI